VNIVPMMPDSISPHESPYRMRFLEGIAPRIHGELLKTGFAVAQSTVGKYMVGKRNDDPSGQSWATFLRNHAPPLAANRRSEPQYPRASSV
jgi:hypothetical protein